VAARQVDAALAYVRRYLTRTRTGTAGTACRASPKLAAGARFRATVCTGGSKSHGVTLPLRSSVNGRSRAHISCVCRRNLSEA